MRARLLAVLLALAGLVATPILPLPCRPSPCPLAGGERVAPLQGAEAAEALTGVVVKLVDGDIHSFLHDALPIWKSVV